MQEFEEALEGLAVKGLKEIGLSDLKGKLIQSTFPIVCLRQDQQAFNLPSLFEVLIFTCLTLLRLQSREKANTERWHTLFSLPSIGIHGSEFLWNVIYRLIFLLEQC